MRPFKVGDRVIRKPGSKPLTEDGYVVPGSIGRVMQAVVNIGPRMRIRWEPPAHWPYHDSWFEMDNFDRIEEGEGSHRWKLSELQELLKDDDEHWAVHCPSCKVVSFAKHGDYVCIACRTDENTPERESVLSVEDPEDGD